MTLWEQIIAALEAARAAARRYRLEAGEIRSRAARISENAVRQGQTRGDFTAQREREAAAQRGEFHLLSPEAAEARIGQLRDAALGEIDEHRRTAAALQERMAADAARALAEVAPSGTEAVAARVEAADAAARVRGLLDGGRSPADILVRARQVADRTMVTALRREIEYLLPADGTLEDAVAHRLDIGIDRSFESLAGLRRALDDAELGMLTGRERDARADQLQVEREWPGIVRQLEQTSIQIDTGPSLEDAVDARLASMAAAGTAGDSSEGGAS